MRSEGAQEVQGEGRGWGPAEVLFYWRAWQQGLRRLAVGAQGEGGGGSCAGHTAGRRRKSKGEARCVAGKEQSQGAQGLGPVARGRHGCRA
jgi:hypothetical protein